MVNLLEKAAEVFLFKGLGLGTGKETIPNMVAPCCIILWMVHFMGSLGPLPITNRNVGMDVFQNRFFKIKA